MQDHIVIRDLVVETHIGCGFTERARVQNITIHIKAYFDAQKAYTSDELEDAVNYIEIIEITKQMAKDNKRKLLESFASDISNEIFTKIPLAQKLEIEMEKYSTATGCRHVGFCASFQR